jgi:hypothetical protein
MLFYAQKMPKKDLFAHERVPLQAPLALLGPPALEAWLCNRVRAGTAGAPVGADGGQSAPRAGPTQCGTPGV